MRYLRSIWKSRSDTSRTEIFEAITRDESNDVVLRMDRTFEYFLRTVREMTDTVQERTMVAMIDWQDNVSQRSISLRVTKKELCKYSVVFYKGEDHQTVLEGRHDIVTVADNADVV